MRAERPPRQGLIGGILTATPISAPPTNATLVPEVPTHGTLGYTLCTVQYRFGAEVRQ
jgi:hypothetical protein